MIGDFTSPTDANGDEWSQSIEPQHHLGSPLSYFIEHAIWGAEATERLQRVIADLTDAPMDRR